MEENVIQVNGRIMTNVYVSAKNVMYVKKIQLQNGKTFIDIFSKYYR